MTVKALRSAELCLLSACLIGAAGCGSGSAAKSSGPQRPSAMRVMSGDHQTGIVGRQLATALAVQVLDEAQQPAARQLVQFAVTSGGGSVLAGSSLTDADGVASASWTLGTTAGPQALEARAVDAASNAPIVTASIAATAIAGAPASSAQVAGDAQSAPVGTSLPVPLAVSVADQYGNAVSGVSVAFQPSCTGCGSAAPASATTDSTGVASSTWTLGSTVGAQHLQAVVSGLAPVPFGATALDASSPPRDLAYASSVATYTVGVAITPDTPTWSGGAITQFEVSPALPDGLALDPASGTIAGTPLSPSAMASYTVTGRGGGGSTSATVTLTVVPQSGPPVCGHPVQSSVAAGSLTVNHLGTHGVGQAVTFTVPAGTASLSIIEQVVSGAPDTIRVSIGGTTSSIDNVAVPLRLVTPSNVTVYDDLVGVGTLTADQIEAAYGYFQSDSAATGTVTFPNTAGGLGLFSSGLPAGAWTVTVGDYAYECATTSASSCTGGTTAGLYDVTVVTKPLAGSAIPASGTLDLDFYFLATSAGGVALSAATASMDVDLQRMVSTLKTIFAGAGITVQNVGFHDLPASVRAGYPSGNVDVNASGACAPLAQLLRSGADGNRMNVFLANNFLASGLPSGQIVAGIDGTIPGPSTVGGTVASGAAVAVANLRAGSGQSRCHGPPSFAGAGACGADSLAYTIAHETGHFLGLYHTTESTGDLFDPLSDTPRCACASCAPSLSVGQCGSTYDVLTSDCLGAKPGCGGGDDLMFWLIDTGATGTISAQQGRIMRANPLVH